MLGDTGSYGLSVTRRDSRRPQVSRCQEDPQFALQCRFGAVFVRLKLPTRRRENLHQGAEG